MERADETMRRAAEVIMDSLPEIAEGSAWYTAQSLDEFTAGVLPAKDTRHMALWSHKVAALTAAWLLVQADEAESLFWLAEHQQQTNPDGTLVLQPDRTTMALAVAKQILGETETKGRER